MAIREAYRNRGLFRMPNAVAAGMVAALALTLTATARAATITVNSLADPGAPGICTLRDAITAANTKTATSGCSAGSGNDTIQFSVTGTISLAGHTGGGTLPQITDSLLTINGPASPGITIDGGGLVTPFPQQAMLVASGATVNLANLTIAHSEAFGGTGRGGIDNGGTLTVTNSTFSANSAVEAAARALITSGGTLTVTNSTFSGNTGGDGGGGIANAGTLTVTNSTFSANDTFSSGGGIENFGTLTVTNSTFVGNGEDGVGAGIYNFSGQSSLKSTILATSSGGDCKGTITDAGYNIADDSTCGFAKTGSANNGDSVNPLLSMAGLANNGGPTKTIALLAGSPAIDAIPLADCTDQASPPNPIITDQRLFPRPDAGEINCDIGAYEVQDAAFVPFSRFGGSMSIDPDAGVFYLSGGFTLGAGGTIDPTTQPVAFGVGSYAVRLPAGSFVKYNTGYVYQKTVNHIFLCVFIKFTSTPGRYILLANRIGGTLTSTDQPGASDAQDRQ